MRTTLLVTMSVLSAVAECDAAGRRVALVIGNGSYEESPLNNPVNDANDMSTVLTSLGFEVTQIADATQRQMKTAVDGVADTVGPGDVCFVFYAGHGQTYQNESYLLPVDAKVERPQHIEDQCVSLGYILRALKFADCSLTIVVIDACRTNMFRSVAGASPGIQSHQSVPEGTIIFFSTAPKTVALDGGGTKTNSPFTRALITTLKSRASEENVISLFLEASRNVRKETGQRPFITMDGSMPSFVLGARDRTIAGLEHTSFRKADAGPGIAELAVYPFYNKFPENGVMPIVVRLKIADGWYVPANPPHPDTMRATKVFVPTSSATKLVRIKYPTAQTESSAAGDIGAYTGSQDILCLVDASETVGDTADFSFEVQVTPCDYNSTVPTYSLFAPVSFRRLAENEEIMKTNVEVFDQFRPKSESL